MGPEPTSRLSAMRPERSPPKSRFPPSVGSSSLHDVGHGGDRRTLRRNVRELPRAAWLLVAGSFVNRFASFAVVFLVLYLTRRGISPARAGLAVAVWGVGAVLASLIGGHLADRVGRRHTVVLSVFSRVPSGPAVSPVH